MDDAWVARLTGWESNARHMEWRTLKMTTSIRRIASPNSNQIMSMLMESGKLSSLSTDRLLPFSRGIYFSREYFDLRRSVETGNIGVIHTVTHKREKKNAYGRVSSASSQSFCNKNFANFT